MRLQIKINKMLTDCDKFCKQSITELEASLAHKRKKVEELAHEKQIMLNRIDDLYQKVNEQNETIKKLKIRLNHFEKNSSKLRNENEVLQQYRQAHQGSEHQPAKHDQLKFKKYERIIAELQGDIQKLSYALEEHKFVREDNGKELMRQEMLINELQEKLSQQNEQFKFNNQMMCQKAEEHFNEELKVQLELKEMEAQELRAKLARLQQQYSGNVQRIIQTCNAVYQEASSRSQEMEKIVSKLKFNKKDVDCELLNIDFDLNQLQCEQLAEKLSDLEQEKQKVASELQSTSHNKVALEMREQDMKGKIQKLERQVEHLKEVNTVRQQTYVDQIAGLQRNNKQLLQDYTRLQREFESLMAEKEGLQSTVQRQEKRIQSLQLGLLQ